MLIFPSLFIVPRQMLETACDRIEEFCKDHLPVVNKKIVIPKLRHQESMAVMVMEPMEPDLSTSPSSSSADEEDDYKNGLPPTSPNGSPYTQSNYVKRPKPGVPRIRRQTEMRLTSMSAK